MKTILKTKQGNFKISSEYLGNKRVDWSNKQDNWHNHQVTVINEKGKKIKFDFWGSIMNPEISNENDLKHAFYCLVSDGIAGKMEFIDFCSELGYNEDSIKASKIFKACQKQSEKLTRLFDGDIYELANELND